MNLIESLGELSGLIVGFLLTLAVLSFVIKDNPLYRLAVHILIGFSAAFAIVIVTREVFLPVFETITNSSNNEQRIFWLIPLFLSLLLLLKAIPRLASIGNISMAVLIAIGAAVGFAGAVAGTLLPQVFAQYDDVLLGIVVALLAICVLAYFFFTGRQTTDKAVVMPPWYPVVGTIGKVVITISLAGVFAGVLNTSLVLLISRVGFYTESFTRVIGTLLP